MFRLPICPYCHTIFRYGDVKNNKENIIECYHCKNEFKKGRIKGYIILGLIITALAVTLNIIILNLTASFVTSIIPIMIVSIVAVILFMILTPFFTEYKRMENNEIKEIPSVNIAEQTNIKQKRSVKTRNRKTNK